MTCQDAKHDDEYLVEETMIRESKFNVLDDHYEISLGQVGKNGLTTLIAGGIINPFGPTLTAVVIDGQVNPGSQHRVVELMLNPFSQTATEVGVAEIGESLTPIHQISKFFALPFGSCPTLLLPCALLERDEVRELYSRFLATFEDGRSVLDKVRAYPGDPWNRVQQDMDGLEALLKSIVTGCSEEPPSGRLTPTEAIELADNLLKPDNLKAELQAFRFAWKGSIEFQGGGAMGKDAMSLETFTEYLALLAISCNLPGIT